MKSSVTKQVFNFLNFLTKCDVSGVYGKSLVTSIAPIHLCIWKHCSANHWWNEYFKLTSWWCRNYWRFSGVSHRSQWKAQSSFTSVSKSISGVQQLLKRLKDITTQDFSTPSFNPKLQPQTSTPNFSTNELFNPGFFYHEYWAEKSGVEAWGWNFQTLKIGGRFNPDFSMNYSILGLFNHTRLKKFWYWNLALKSPGLKCPHTPMDLIFNPRWLKSLGLK